MKHTPGEPDAGKLACPVRKGAVGNVPQGNALAAYQMEKATDQQASPSRSKQSTTPVGRSTGVRAFMPNCRLGGSRVRASAWRASCESEVCPLAVRVIGRSRPRVSLAHELHPIC